MNSDLHGLADDDPVFDPRDFEGPKPCPHLRPCASMPGTCPGRANCPMEDNTEETEEQP